MTIQTPPPDPKQLRTQAKRSVRQGLPEDTAHWTENNQQRRRRASIEHTLGIVDRALSNRCEELHVVDVPDAPPGWTDGVILYLNAAVLPTLGAVNEPTDLAIWLGANGHELGHSIYSPPIDSQLMKWVKEDDSNGASPGIRKVENLVEDQRMERLMVARFRPWRTYLTATAVKILVEQPLENASVEHIGHAWPWLAGRTWLPADVRAESKGLYPGDADKLADNIGAYQHLHDPGWTQAGEAMRLLDAIYDQLLADGIISPDTAPPIMGCDPLGQKPDQKSTTPEKLTASDDAVPTAGSDQDDEQLDEADDEKGLRNPDDDSDDGADGNGDGSDGDGDADDEGSGDEGSGDADGDGDGDSDDDWSWGDGDGSGGQGASKGGTKEVAGDDGGFEEAGARIQQQVIDSLVNDQDVIEEIMKLKASLDDEVPEDSRLPRNRHAQRRVVDYELAAEGYALSQEFRKLKEAAEPGWLTHRDNGVLDIDRLVEQIHSDSPDYDVIFDEWEPGAQEEVSLDVTILLDSSGSMNYSGWVTNPVTGAMEKQPGPIQDASKVAWQIRKAVDVADGTSRLISFDNNSYLVESETERPRDETYAALGAGGGTNPKEAIRDTWNRLRTVNAAHRIVVIITDGEWGGRILDPETKQWGKYIESGLIEDMRAEGITVVGVVLNSSLLHVDKNDEYAMRKAQKVSQAILDKMGVDPELSYVYGSVTEVRDQFARIAEKLMTDAMHDVGVIV